MSHSSAHNRDPLVSVIIRTCYGRSEFLTEAVDSVVAQTYGPIEIVIVEDGSRLTKSWAEQLCVGEQATRLLSVDPQRWLLPRRQSRLGGHDRRIRDVSR